MKPGAPEFDPTPLTGTNPNFRVLLGQRLAHIRGSTSQPDFAAHLGVHKNTYGGYERGERVPDAEALATLAADGWNITWVLTGVGPELMNRVAEEAAASGSHPVSREALTIALQQVSEVVDGNQLPMSPAKRAELTMAVAELHMEGVPEAKVLRFVRSIAA